jgi:hypothetical protein
MSSQIPILETWGRNKSKKKIATLIRMESSTLMKIAAKTRYSAKESEAPEA